MTPGTFLTVRCSTLAQLQALWDQLRARVPPQWVCRPGHAALCAALGMDPSHMLHLDAPSRDGAALTLVVLFNKAGREIQVTNVMWTVPAEPPPGGVQQAAAVGAFVLEWIQPLLDEAAASSGARPEVSIPSTRG